MRLSLQAFRLATVLVFLAIAVHASAHGPAGHKEKPEGGMDEQAMKAQHGRMGAFREAMSSLLESVVDGNGSGARDPAARLTEALQGYEKDVPHKNAARIKEFKGYYAELSKRIDRLSNEARSGGTPKIAAAYGRVLETCAACHAKFRD